MRADTVQEFFIMRKEYDFSKSVKNPYAKHLKKQVTLRLGIDVIDYFKTLAEETGVPYQNLINLYLQDCAHSQKKLKLTWASQYHCTGKIQGSHLNYLLFYS